MYRLTLEWSEGYQRHSKTISALEENQSNAIIRIGRDKKQCDVVVNDTTNTVSRLHAEIFFNSNRNKLYLRNSTRERAQPNPVIVDRQRVIEQDIPLQTGSLIQLGKVTINVKSLLIIQPQLNQPRPNQSVSQQEYGLQCINGHKVSYDHVGLFCPYCGTGLQSVDTIVISRATTT